MEYSIRPMQQEEYPLLSDFLYMAIYVPNGVEPPPKSVIHLPELQAYIADFGKSVHDRAFVAVACEKVVGAAWVRMIKATVMFVPPRRRSRFLSVQITEAWASERLCSNSCCLH